MKNHSALRLAAILALTALFLIPLRASAQTEVTAWTTKDGTTFWARLVGLNGKDLILMAGGRDFPVPVSRLSAGSVGKAGRELGLPEARLMDAGASSSALQENRDAADRAAEGTKPLTYAEVYGPVPLKCQPTATLATDQNSEIRSAGRATCPQAGAEPVVVLSATQAEPRDASGNESDTSDLGLKVIAFCNRNLGVKVGNGQCATLAVHALEFAGAAGMGRDFPKRGDYVWGGQVALIEHGRREIAGLESLAKVRPGDIIQFRDVRLAGRGPGGVGTYGMTAEHHTAVVATVDPVTAVLTCYHQNWGKKTVKQDRMQLKDLQSGWMRIYRPLAAK